MSEYKLIDPIVQAMLEFSHLGKEKTENGTVLYGKAPHIGKKAFLHTLYPPLKETEIVELGKKIGTTIPKHLAELYKECNGLHYFVDIFTIDGLRSQLGRSDKTFFQPYDLATINVDERIENAEKDMIFFGGYDWDGSLIYTKETDKQVHVCSPDSVAPLKTWPSIKEFLEAESERILQLFDLNGIIKNDENSTLPY